MPQVGRRKRKRTGLGVGSAHDIIVSTKKKWDDDWEIEDDLIPLSATWAVAPSISVATFRHDFGQRKIESDPTFGQRDPYKTDNRYVKIEAFGQASSSVPISAWVGQFVSDSRRLDGVMARSPDAAGRQTLTAYGLEHLLRKCPIDRTYFERWPGGLIHQGPAHTVFNRRDRLTNGLVGNRSALGQIPVRFSSGETKFTHFDIVTYLLRYLVNTRLAPQFWYTPQTAAELSEITIEDLWGLSVWDALNKLIDRRRGMGWRVRTTGAGFVDLHVFSIVDQPITVGNVTIPANPVQVTKRIDPKIEIEEFVVTESELPAYKKIIVRGAPIIAMFTVSYVNGTLEPDWSTTQETLYRHALKNSANYPSDKATKAMLNDRFRNTDARVAGVYLRHRIPANWDFLVGRNVDSSEFIDIPVVPLPLPDGTVVGSGLVGGPDQFAPPKTLLRHLPILAGIDYSKSPPVVEHDAATQAEFRPPCLLVRHDRVDSDGVTHVDVRAVETLGKDGDTLPATSVRMLDTSMGFALRVGGSSIAHEWAGSFGTHASPFLGDGTWEPTQLYPYDLTSVDYTTLRATVAVELDTRPYVEINPPTTQENETTLVIDLPSIQYWRAADGTILGVNEQGLTSRIHSDNMVLRDDTPQLRRIAAFIRSWFAKPRATVRFRQRSLEFIEPGSLLMSVAVGQIHQQTNTVVTRVTWDLLTQTTELESQFGELDALRLVGARRA